VHAYTEGGFLQGFDLEHNVWFQSGASVPDGDGLTTNCLVGGLQPVTRTRAISNYGWSSSLSGGRTRFGYSSSVTNEDLLLEDNYLVGRSSVDATWTSLTVTGNTFIGDVDGIDATSYPDNDYVDALPIEVHTALIDNEYDPERAYLVVYNHAAADEVDVDLSSIVEQGASYEIHSVMNVFDDPVATGVVGAGPVTVQMGLRPPPQPNGLDGAIVASDDPGKAFGVFVITHSLCK